MDNPLDFENEIWAQGVNSICGIDEVGRGPLAGPVVAAAVVLPVGTMIDGIDDSKRIKAVKRVELKPLIEKAAVDFGLGVVSEGEIDRLNITRATFLAMQRAVGTLKSVPGYLLVDGNQFPVIMDPAMEKPLLGRALIKGDRRSLSIACASILAKVHRDQLMEHYAELYPGYGFEKHKGYGTMAHRKKIKELGLSPIHRKSFLKSMLNEQIPFPEEKL